VVATPAGLAVGTYVAEIDLLPSGGVASARIPVTLMVTTPASTAFPAITAVVNAASFGSGPVAPGEIVTIGGTNLGPANPLGLALDSNGKVATLLGGVSVSFNGYLAPLIYVSAQQINCVVPYEAAGMTAPFVEVKNSGFTSNVYPLSLAAAAPAIFTLNGSGSGLAAAIDSRGIANGPGNPAAPGSTLVFYMTGEGQTKPTGVTGEVTSVNASPTGPLTPQTILPVSVTIGGQPSTVTFYGEAPGLVAGVMQLNVLVPAGLPSGPAPLSISLGSVSSQPGASVYIAMPNDN
jgi:uncharacterized protein (TIGR03437 family)